MENQAPARTNAAQPDELTYEPVLEPQADPVGLVLENLRRCEPTLIIR